MSTHARASGEHLGIVFLRGGVIPLPRPFVTRDPFTRHATCFDAFFVFGAAQGHLTDASLFRLGANIVDRHRAIFEHLTEKFPCLFQCGVCFLGMALCT
jgi:hypothetical protein